MEKSGSLVFCSTESKFGCLADSRFFDKSKNGAEKMP